MQYHLLLLFVWSVNFSKGFCTISIIKNIKYYASTFKLFIFIFIFLNSLLYFLFFSYCTSLWNQRRNKMNITNSLT